MAVPGREGSHPFRVRTFDIHTPPRRIITWSDRFRVMLV